jgi:hypothetical protein
MITSQVIEGRRVYAVEGSEAPAGKGVSCRFFTLPREPGERAKGLKVYGNKLECFNAFWTQRVAASSGLAPQAFELVLVRLPSEWPADGTWITRWGYITEACETIIRSLPYDAKRIVVNSQEMQTVKQRLADLIGHTQDHHSGNFGLLDGYIVGIDFGEDSLSRIALQLTMLRAKFLGLDEYGRLPMNIDGWDRQIQPTLALLDACKDEVFPPQAPVATPADDKLIASLGELLNAANLPVLNRVPVGVLPEPENDIPF